MKTIFLLNIVYLGQVSCLCDSTSAEVCKLNQNTDLPHVYTRHPSIVYSSSTDDTKYCDLHALQHGTWYRSSYNLITECVDHRKCGTSDPIWLNGSLPTDTDGTVDGTGCVRTFDSCCESTLALKIRNCTYYMVYCFIDLHSACHSRYCLDTDLSIETTTAATTTATTAASATTDSSENGEDVTSDNASPYKGAFFAVLTILVLTVVGLCFAGKYIYNAKFEPKTKVGTSKASLIIEPAISTGTGAGTLETKASKISEKDDNIPSRQPTPISVNSVEMH